MLNTIRSLTLLLLLVPIKPATALPTIQYWTDTTDNGWLAACCKTESASRLTLIAPDGTPDLDLVATIENPSDTVHFYQLPEPELPYSAWWHREGALSELHDSIDTQSTASYGWQQSATAAKLEPESPAASKKTSVPQHFIPLAETVPLQSTDPLVQVFGLTFKLTETTLPEALLNLRFQQINLKYDTEMRAYESRKFGSEEWSAEIIHELRLLHYTPEYCSAIVITRAQRRYASTSISLEAIHLQHNPDDTWSFYDPLERVQNPDALSEAIRITLNAQGASGDFFTERHPDPLSQDARNNYTAIQIGSQLHLLFEPYTVHVGAYGTVHIALPTTL
jgi:hypothetical protein